jgi:hypothetical protein
MESSAAPAAVTHALPAAEQDHAQPDIGDGGSLLPNENVRMPRLAPPSSPPAAPVNDSAGIRLETGDEPEAAWLSRRVDLLGDTALSDEDDDGASWFGALFGH